MGKKVNQKKVQSTQNVRIRGNTEKVFRLVCAGRDTKFISDKLGIKPNNVGKYLSRLHKYGYLDKKEKGVYTKSKKHYESAGSTPIDRDSDVTEEKTDYFRLHSLEIEIRTNSTNHGVVKSMIMNDKKKYKTRSSGNNGGHYFDLGNLQYMITRKKLFLFYPEDWDLEADSLRELSHSLYDVLRDDIQAFESRFRISCFKDKRVNFNIRNMHIALVKNGIVKEFKENKINNLVIKDEDDGKPRFIMDFSHGLPELEAIHPEYAFNDADEAKYFMNHLKDGKVRDFLDASKEFFNQDKPMSVKEIQKTIGQSVKLNEEIHKIIEKQSKTVTHFQKNLVSLNESQEVLDSLNNSVRVLTELQKVHSSNLNLIVESQVRSQKQIESIATGLNAVTTILSSQNKPKQIEKESDPDWSYFS